MKIKRSAIIFSIIMSVSILVFSFSVQADEKEYSDSETEGIINVNNLNVTLNGEEISSELEMSENDKMQVSMELEISADAIDAGGDYTVLSFSDSLKASVYATEVMSEIDGKSLKIGTLGSTGNEITFTADATDALDMISSEYVSASVSFEASLNMDIIGEGEGAEIRFDTGSVSKLYNIRVKKSDEMELLRSSDGAVAIANTGDWTPTLTAVTMKLNGTEITENQEISGNDELELDMKFDINLSFDDSEQEAIIVAGGPYVLTTLPDSLVSALNSPLDVNVQIGEKQITIGTLTRDDKEIKLQFAAAVQLENEIGNAGQDGIGSVSTVFLVSLDMDKIGEAENADIKFVTASQTTTYKVKVKENMPVDPEIEKEGKLNAANGTIDWTVKVTMGGEKYNAQDGSMPAFVLKDKLGSNQSYVAKSFKINGSSVDDQGVTCSRDDTTHEQTICYKYTPDETVNTKGTVITYTYQTKINPSAYVNDTNQLINGGTQESKINNEAQLLLADGNPITPTATAEVPYNMAKTWMTKTANPVPGSAFGEVEWVITINTNNANGYTLNSVTLHDQLDAALQLKGDIKVEYQKADRTTIKTEEIPGSEFQNGLLGGDTGHKFENLTDVNNITVTYRTEFGSTDAFQGYINSHTDPKNKAWAEWEWEDYWGPGTGTNKVGIPELSKPAGLFEGVISKSGQYDPTTHEITWTITINENNVTINQPVIEDYIKDHQEYVPDSVTVTDGNVMPTEITGNTKGTIKFQYNGPINSTQTFQFRTKIVDKDFYADNSTELWNFWNNAWLYDGDSKMAWCQAAVRGESKVITKEAGEYDYANKKLTWTIVVNQNKAEMKDIVVIDQLPKGVTLDENSVQYQISEGSQSTGSANLTATGNAPGYSYEKDNGTFILYLPDMNAGDGLVTVTYDTFVNDITEFKNSTSDVEITNSATLRNNYDYKDVTVSATQEISNNILSKTGEIPSDDKRCIEYTVKINGNRVTLPEGTLIKDTLPAGLQLKLDSVRLYEATVGHDGEFTQSTEVDSTKYKISTASLDDQKIEFSLMLPDDCGDKAYILKYRTFIIDENKAPFTNIVTMNQLNPGNNKSHSMDKQYVSTNYASGTLFSSSPHLEIILTDADNPDKKIEGAVYELIENGNVISQGVTDKDGKVTFYGVDKGKDYTIRQKTTSDGYELPSNPDTNITIKAGKNTVLLTNKKPQKIPEKGENAGGNGDSDHSKNDAGGNHDSVNENKANEMKPQSALNQMQYPEEKAAGKMLPKTGGFWGTGIIYLIGTGSVILGLSSVFFMQKWSTVFKFAGYMVGVAGAALILITLCSNLYSLMMKQQEIANFERPDLIVEPIDVEDITLKDEADSEFDYDVQIENLLDENGVMAVLSIPSISCKEIIREGSEKATLAKALGHMEGTALPGQTGNCAIAGHRNYNFGMYFNRLDEVEVDDEIIVTTKTDSYIYKVTEIKVVEPEDLSVLEPADDTQITLITCTPLYVATHRLIVIGKLV